MYVRIIYKQSSSCDKQYCVYVFHVSMIVMFANVLFDSHRVYVLCDLLNSMCVPCLWYVFKIDSIEPFWIPCICYNKCGLNNFTQCINTCIKLIVWWHETTTYCFTYVLNNITNNQNLLAIESYARKCWLCVIMFRMLSVSNFMCVMCLHVVRAHHICHLICNFLCHV